MVSLTLNKRLAALEKVAPQTSVEAEVAEILRSRMNDPAMSQHRREMASLVLEAGRCRMKA